MDFALSPEQELIQQNIILFARKELNAFAEKRDKEESFPHDLWLKCGMQKLQGLPVDEQHGGAGLDPVSVILALEALGYASADGGLNFAVAAHLLSCVVPIQKYGSPEQKASLLPDLCKGARIAANAMTEAGSGSDIASMRTLAKPHPEGFILSGSKAFITNAPVADLFLLYAITDENKGYFGGITAFLVPKGTKGLTVGPPVSKMGLRSCPMAELYIENMVLPVSAVLGGVGGGSAVFSHAMDWERTGLSACHAGTMRRLLEETITYLQTRRSGSRELGSNQALKHRVAEMKSQLEASRMLVYKAAWNIGKNQASSLDASIAKLFVSQAFTSIAQQCLDLHGGNGYTSAYEFERILRDATGSRIYSGTSDIQRNIIAGWLGL